MFVEVDDSPVQKIFVRILKQRTKIKFPKPQNKNLLPFNFSDQSNLPHADKPSLRQLTIFPLSIKYSNT